MSWPLFAVIQLGIFTLGVTVAFWLRNRELKKRCASLEKDNGKALAAIEQAKEQIEQAAEQAAEQVSINDRLEAVDGDDEVATMQRLVLENALDPSEDFHDKMFEQLNSGAGAQQTLRDRWQEIRTETHELSVEMVTDLPLSHQMVGLMYKEFAKMDEALAVETPELPPIPDPVIIEETDDPEAETEIDANADSQPEQEPEPDSDSDSDSAEETLTQEEIDKLSAMTE